LLVKEIVIGISAVFTGPSDSFGAISD